MPETAWKWERHTKKELTGRVRDYYTNYWICVPLWDFQGSAFRHAMGL